MGGVATEEAGEGAVGAQDRGPGGYQGAGQGQCPHHQADRQELQCEGEIYQCFL